MKIHLDMQGVQTASRHRGIGRYTSAITAAFVRVTRDRHDLRLLFNAALDGTDEVIDNLARIEPRLARGTYGPIRHTSSDNPRNDVRRQAAERMHTLALESHGADAVWLSSLVEGFTDDALIPHDLPAPLTIATLYDLIPLHEADQLGYSRARDWYMRRIDLLKRCDLLLAISDWVRTDAIGRIGIDPAKVVTIGAGVDDTFHPATPGTDHRRFLAERFHIERPFVLYNGGTDRRKNVEALFPAFAGLSPSLRATHHLVIVGRMDESTRWRLQERARASGLDSTQVVFTGFVSDNDLVRLYQACSLFVFPSEREGFGLPPLEAMACGAPVLVNDAASLPEVVGDPSTLFDVGNPASITAAMQGVLGDPSRAATLRETGMRRAAEFTWDKVASRAMEAMEAAYASRALVRPVPAPSWSTVSSPEQAKGGGGTQIPVYLLHSGNVHDLLPAMRAWPGLVEWQGPLPPDDRMSPLDRFRIGGYAAMADKAHGGGWEALLERETVATRLVGESGPDDRPHWVEAHASHPLVRQRAVEDEIALAIASRLDDDALAQVADAIDRLRPSPRRRWLVDVTHISDNDLKTGVQRVVRSILVRWLRHPPEGVDIEPVAFRAGRYHHAHTYATQLLDVPLPPGLSDQPVAVSGDEVFVGLDWAMESLPSSVALLRTWRRAGVAMHFIVHDLLPVTLPEAFHTQTRDAFVRWLETMTSVADVIHCVSEATAGDARRWLREAAPRRTPRVSTFPLGANPFSPRAAKELPPPLRDATAARPTLLMVGTLEPRKGHAQALAAFDILTSANLDVNLVVVGKQGWMVNELVAELRGHTELNKRLFWLDDADDDLLEAIYKSATVLVAPSLGEGFGLPLIEAARRGLPIVARDLPVFRETVGDYPSYFVGESGAELATHVTRWLSHRHAGKAPPAWHDWDASARILASAVAAGGR